MHTYGEICGKQFTVLFPEILLACRLLSAVLHVRLEQFLELQQKINTFKLHQHRNKFREKLEIFLDTR